MIEDLRTVSLQTFLPFQGDIFWMHVPGVPAPLQVQLTQAAPSRFNEINAQRPLIVEVDFLRKEAFSLIFRGPKESPVIQGTYTFEHRLLGAFGLFITPVGADKLGLYYQAVFN